MTSKKPLVLIIAGNDENWFKASEKYKDYFDVDQAPWSDLSISSYPNTKACIRINPNEKPIDDKQKKSRIISPDLILIRNLCRYIGGIGQKPDYRNILFGIFHAGIPMINSLYEVLSEGERPIMMGRLKPIQKRIGKENFPLIPQTYYSDTHGMVIMPDYPFVMKVSYPHAGYGKMLIRTKDEYEDLKSVLYIHHDYCSAEPFIESEYEVRIAFIAPDYYRAHKRISANWKVNYGIPNIIEDIDMTPKYKMWVDEIRKEMPEMDVFCIDTIVDKEGNEYILEVNGSTQGFDRNHETESLEKLAQLIMIKLNFLQNEKPQNDNPVVDSDKDLEILNLRNDVNFIQNELSDTMESVNRLKSVNLQLRNQLNEARKIPRSNKILFVIIGILSVLLIIAIVFIFIF